MTRLGYPRSMEAGTRDFVTVVSGLPRSGTSLLMQMLAAGGLPVLADASRPPDRHNPRGYFELAAAKRLPTDAGFLASAVGRAVKLVVPLACALPAGSGPYRVVLVRRSLDEVLASQDAMLEGDAPDGLPEPRLREIFRAQLAELEAWAETRPDVALLAVEHAELLAEPRRIAAALSEFLGGGLDLAAMAAAVDPSLYRQRS